MKQTIKTKKVSRLLNIPAIWLLLSVCWLLVIGGFLWKEINDHKQSIYALAAVEARASFNKDLVYRRWSAGHGGTYVPVTDNTPPNPYLSHVAERDITTPSGKQLTLVNPAYMTRQVHELGREQYGVRGHITSLNPIRPENRPDEWEIEALKSFKSGADEVKAVNRIGNNRYLRLMRPMITEKGCLSCHAVQGYREGDLRGGISVSIPLEPYERIAAANIRGLLNTHILILVIGLSGLGLGGLLLHKKDIARYNTLKELQLSEKRLKESEGKFRDFTSSITDIYFAMDKNLNYTFWNAACEKALGLKYETVMGRSWYDFEFNKGYEWMADKYKEVLKSGRSDSFEASFGTGKNQVYYLTNVYPTQKGIVVYLQDITQRKKATEALEQSHQMLEIAEKIAKIGGWEWDLKSNQVTFSTNALRLYGIKPEEYDGNMESIFSVFHPDDAELVQKEIEEMLTEKKPRQFEYRVVDPDGTITFIEGTNQMYFDDQGEIIRLVGHIQDISERKQAEEQKKKLQARLQQSQKMEAIGTMAGGIAHDFNNILSAIIGYTELSFDEVKKGSILYDNLQGIYQAGNRARSLVKQILTFSRQNGLEFQPVQASLVVKEALKLLRASIPTTIKIESDIKSDSFVLADPSQIHQVLMNLCTNANYAMQEKGVLGVTLEDVEIEPGFTDKYTEIRPGSYLKLTVSDTGCGMSAEVMERVFDPFYTTKAKGEGTGMGLSVVHGIVKNHGGIVNVTSEPGQGSTFNVYFPVIEENIEQLTENGEKLIGGNEIILIVDDEKSIVDIGEKILTSLGYTVDGITDSKAALEQFRTQPDKYDLVITDMTMPDLPGDELAAEIISIRPGIPIIICTGFSEKLDGSKAADIGISAFIFKPILKQTMAATIRRVLDEKKTNMNNELKDSYES